jgi:hypothetical protein
MLPIETVALVGADAGLALVASLGGCAVRLCVSGAPEVAIAFEALRRRADLAVASGALTRTERQRALDGVLFTPDLAEAATGADLAADLSHGPGSAARLATLAAHVRATAILAVGFPPSRDVAKGLPQPGRILALGLAPTGGPLPRVVAVALPTTSPHALERATEFASRVNRAARTGR